MAENTLPTRVELKAVTGVDLSVSQLPTLENFSGNELVHIVSDGMDYKMDATRFAAELAGSEVSMADLRVKADKSSVDDLAAQLALLEVKKADKAALDALAINVAELDLSKASRAQFTGLETRVNAVEQRVAGAERSVTEVNEEITGLKRRVSTAESQIVTNATLAQKGVDDAARAQIKANAADQTAQEATSSIAVQKGRIDSQATTIARIDNEVSLQQQRLTDVQGQVSGINTRVSGLDTALSQVTGRVSAIEADLPTYAKASSVTVVQGQVTQVSQDLVAVDLRVTRNRTDIDQLNLDLLELINSTSAEDARLQAQIDILRTDLAALKERVDAIAIDGGLVPSINAIGTVTQPAGYEGRNFSCSIVSNILNSYGAPVASLIFAMETRRNGSTIWQNAASMPFRDIDSGASVQLDVTVAVGELFEYRLVLRDKYRPGWSSVIKEFAFVGN